MTSFLIVWALLTAPLWCVALDKRTDPWLHGFTYGLIVAATIVVCGFWEAA